MSALKHFYRDLGRKTWGVYGFHDGFNETDEWYDEVYMGLNEGRIRRWHRELSERAGVEAVHVESGD